MLRVPAASLPCGGIACQDLLHQGEEARVGRGGGAEAGAIRVYEHRALRLAATNTFSVGQTNIISI